MANLTRKGVPDKVFVVIYKATSWSYSTGIRISNDFYSRLFWNEGQANRFARENNGKVLPYANMITDWEKELK